MCCSLVLLCNFKSQNVQEVSRSVEGKLLFAFVVVHLSSNYLSIYLFIYLSI